MVLLYCLLISESQKLELLARTPADLAEYNRCKIIYKEKYGGTLQYILRKKLKWLPDVDDPSYLQDDLSSKLEPASTIFLGDKHDVQILYNDFSYAVEEGIYHVVVWSKTPSPKAADGYISDAAKESIEHYVVETFIKKLGMRKDDILWFRNTTALQSIRALEHFHVLLKTPPIDKLNQLIGTAGYLEDIK